MEKKFPAYLKKHMTEGDGEGWKYYELFLLPYRDVHSNTADIGLDYINYQKFDKNYTNIFLVIALIVLAIACINFMNLSTARSAERAKEVGIRKSIGAQRFQLGFQFLGETVVLSIIALMLAIVFVILALPYIENLSRSQSATATDVTSATHAGNFCRSRSGGTDFRCISRFLSFFFSAVQSIKGRRQIRK